MAIKYVVAHRKDPNNVGDIASNPLQYFLKPDEYMSIDVAHIGEEAYPEDVPLIVGGGGLIGNNFMGDFFASMCESSDRNQIERMWDNFWTLSNPDYKELYDDFHENLRQKTSELLNKIKPVTAPRIIWGAGHNSEDTSKEFPDIKWPKVFAKYKLVGLRDYNPASKFNWTPCASCMHPAFDRTYKIKNDIIWFEHKKQLIKSSEFGPASIPRFVNSGNNIEQTIELLGSANTIITNSYHGVYWGTLLKKKVILAGGVWSSKFKYFKHPPTIVGKKETWEDCMDETIAYPNALEECRKATNEYWQRIKSIS